MATIYVGSTLINDIFLGSDRMGLETLTDLQIDWLVIGGGGSGGTYNTTNGAHGGGAGAGRFVSSSAVIQKPSTLEVVVGAGGLGRNAGGAGGRIGNPSTLTIAGTKYGAVGGGIGGGGNAGGGPGGSGGGGGGAATATRPGGSNRNPDYPILGFGNNGGTTLLGNLSGSAGGGAGSDGDNGGAGYAWLDGITYCIGGGGAPSGSMGSTAGCGSAGANVGEASLNGNDGIVIIRYLGGQKATGGTITSNGGYTYHTFSSVTTSSFIY